MGRRRGGGLDRRAETVRTWKAVDSEGSGQETLETQNRKHIRNEQGVRVRVFYAARLPMAGRVTQKLFWSNRTTMDASFAHAAFEQRLRQAEGLCRSLSNDAKDVNANNPNLKGNPIQLELDFTYVAAERKPAAQTIPISDKAIIVDTTKPKPKPR